MQQGVKAQLAREQLVERVRELAAQQVAADAANVTLETHFINDLNYDSLESIEFIMALEDEFDISIPDEQAQDVHTVAQAVELLARHLG